MTAEPDRVTPDEALSARMSVLARKDTKPELALRRALHARGHRYRVQLPVPGVARRRIDIAFPRRKVAVFVDGCFWHRCPVHCRLPATNEEWWLWKLDRNTARDTDTNRHLAELGWTVVRVWEHHGVDEMVADVEAAIGTGTRRVAPPNSESVPKPMQPGRWRVW